MKTNSEHSPRKLTESMIRELTFNGKPYAVRDTAVVGLMVSVNKRSKSYKVQRDLWTGEWGRRHLVKTVRRSLGTTDTLSLDEARTRAMELIALIKRGEDPNKKVPATKAEAWTVGQMFAEYVKDLGKRDCSERTIAHVNEMLSRYLHDWKEIPISEIKRSMAREKHEQLTARRGKSAANHAMRVFKAAYNFALRVADNADALADNPIKAVTFNREYSSNRVLMPEDLRVWWEKAQVLPNPLRRCMLELGLFSGLRPGTLVSIRREWVRLEQRAISIPKMKSGRSFDLPLSEHMVGIIRHALDIGDVLYPSGQPWLFPTRSRVTGKVRATMTVREKTLPSQSGHILRHTYRTLCQRVGIDKIDARLLVDHAVPGIDGVYIHEKALFDRLLAAQERMSAEILRLVTREASP